MRWWTGPEHVRLHVKCAVALSVVHPGKAPLAAVRRSPCHLLFQLLSVQGNAAVAPWPCTQGGRPCTVHATSTPVVPMGACCMRGLTGSCLCFRTHLSVHGDIPSPSRLQLRARPCVRRHSHGTRTSSKTRWFFIRPPDACSHMHTAGCGGPSRGTGVCPHVPAWSLKSAPCAQGDARCGGGCRVDCSTGGAGRPHVRDVPLPPQRKLWMP